MGLLCITFAVCGFDFQDITIYAYIFTRVCRCTYMHSNKKSSGTLELFCKSIYNFPQRHSAMGEAQLRASADRLALELLYQYFVYRFSCLRHSLQNVPSLNVCYD